MGLAPELTPAWSFACPDWEQRLRDGRSLVPDLPIDQVEGARAVSIFDKLCLPDVVGTPSNAVAAGDWFRDIVRAVFGSLDKETGVRHVSELFALVPKKNSKTTGAAGLAITALLLNVRPRAEMLLIGPTQEIADLAFQQASGIIAADPDGYLQKRFRCVEHVKTIFDRRTGAKLKIKTFDMKVLTGSKPVLVILDELHVMSSLHYASRVIGQIRGGLMPNKESLLVIITTQSDEPPSGVFKSELQYARSVRDGVITEGVRMLPVLYEFPEAMQTSADKPWRDPANWHMVLPNLGRSITLDRLVADYRAARDKGDEEERRWASQHLNVEIGLALHSDRWVGVDYWQAASEPRITLDYIKANCDVCVVGGDVGGLDDLWGLAVIGRHKETRHWMAWAKAWAQPVMLERHKQIAETLRDFVAEGSLVICKHVTQDVEEVTAIILDLDAAGLLPEVGAVGLDPNGVPALMEELAAHEIGPPKVASVGQGYRLSPAIFGAERKLADGTLKHCGSLLLGWCVANASAQPRGQNVYIEKRSPSAKIDPLMALFNAVEMMSRNPTASFVDLDDFLKNGVMA